MPYHSVETGFAVRNSFRGHLEESSSRFFQV
jgi:hypothetical protein